MKTDHHTIDSKLILWTSVQKWCIAKYGKVNLSKLANESGIGLGTAARLKDLDVTVGLDKIHAIAATFGIPIWKLLDPSFDPPQVTQPLSAEARSLAQALDQISNPEVRRRVHTIASQVIDFAQTPSSDTSPTATLKSEQ